MAPSLMQSKNRTGTAMASISILSNDFTLTQHVQCLLSFHEIGSTWLRTGKSEMII